MAVDNKEIVNDDEDEIQEDQFLSFGIDKETFAIDLLSVMEIIRFIEITTIPETFNFIKGIINLRGKIVPVMDVRLRFHLPEKTYEERACIIVVSIKGLEMGLVVDHVCEVIEIPQDQINTLSSVSTGNSQRFVRGIGKTDNGVKIILDLDKMLFDEELETLKGTNFSK